MKVVIDIQKIGHRAMGTGRWEGKVFLVPLTAPGDCAEVKVTRAYRHYNEAEIVGLRSPSPVRQEPRCLFFGICGGCQLQHLPIGFQRAYKEEIFRELLTHQGKVESARIETMVGGLMRLNTAAISSCTLISRGNLALVSWAARQRTLFRSCTVGWRFLRLRRLWEG